MDVLEAASPIASPLARAYLLPMLARRLVRILAILAILLAPMGMMGGAAAMAQPGGAAPTSPHEQSAEESGHCAGMSGENQENHDSSPQQECLSNCAVTCAAIPVLGNSLGNSILLLAVAHPLSLADGMRGLNPESADPPPRTA